MTFSFSIALAVFQQFELTGANYLNMEMQMENAAGKLFHSQAFSLALLASGVHYLFYHLLRWQGFRPLTLLPAVTRALWSQWPSSRAPHPACAPFFPLQVSCANTLMQPWAGVHAPWPAGEPTRLKSHYGETELAPEPQLTSSFHHKPMLTLSWPCLQKSTDL